MRKIIKLDPSNKHAYRHLARLLAGEGKTDEAETVLKQAVAAIGNDAGLQLDLAEFTPVIKNTGAQKTP